MAEARQELRLALVMNGGVSLAVWMGGVTRELDLVRRAAPGAYKQLLDLTETDARIDVIAGASAGGINGAVLALAIARDTDVDALRELWLENASMELLLRNPFERDAPSVMQGDEVLLARLHEALAQIGKGGGDGDPDEPRPPLYLSITGTILEGKLTTYPDRFGATIPDVSQRALFEFRRPGVPKHGDPWPDHFERPKEGKPDLAAAQLALAARSSASFPGAFEPSFVPIGEARDEMHPDMAGVVDFDSSRWLIDGGVLDNTPFRPALDAIKALPADRPVRRVVGYVVPDPAMAKPTPQEEAPAAAEVVLDALSRLPRVQSVGRELAEIEATNHRSRRRRAARENALTGLTADRLEKVALLLLPAYTSTRRAAAADDVVRALVHGSGASSYPDAGQVEALRHELAGSRTTPWLPPPTRSQTLHVGPPAEWQWGLAPVENAGNFALDVLARMAYLRGYGDGGKQVRELRRKLHESLAELRKIERVSLEYWRGAAREAFLERKPASTLAAGWKDLCQERLGETALAIAAIVTSAAAQLKYAHVTGDDAPGLRKMLATVDPGDPSITLRRLLALDVIQRASGLDLQGIEQEMELVLMSAQAANAFGRSTRPEDKLAGLQAGHFGAFYKRSWRANDWMWGRLDGADRLVRALLDPRRVKRRLEVAGVEKVLLEVRAIACGSDLPGVPDWLMQQWDEPAVRKELEELAALNVPPPPTALPKCYEAIQRRVQVEIVVEEIPGVARAVVEDRELGAAADSLGSKWEREFPAGTPLTVTRAVEAFQECDVGVEKLDKEVGSDLFTKASTKSAGVIGSVVGGAAPGVRLLKPVLATIRGLLLTFYLLGRGVTESSKTGAFLVALTLAVGGTLIAVFILGTDVPGLLLLLAVMILAAGVLLAAVRHGGVRILLFVLVLAVSAAGYYGVREWHGRPGFVDPAAKVLAVALIAFGATLLGLSGRRSRTLSGAAVLPAAAPPEAAPPPPPPPPPAPAA